MPSKDINRFLRDMEHYFSEREVQRRIDGAKRELEDLTRSWSQGAVTQSVPIGPSHRREFTEGDLRRSVSYDATNYGDNASYSVSVGGGAIDYEFYAAARDGVEFFRGRDEVEKQGEEIVKRWFSP